MCDPRPTCARCRLPAVVCVCEAVQTRQISRKVLVLQHPKERGRTINTGRLVPLVLPNSRLLVGASFNAEELAPHVEPPAYVLFPGRRAMGPESIEPGGGTLIVLDGTWSTARKMFATSPGLADLPCVALAPQGLSRYRIRRQPDPGYLCTLEAVAALLDCLDEAEAARALLRPFDRLVERQLAFQEFDRPRRRAR